ncbi:MAG: Uma2 family endonuclease [Sandaracinus sp.]
MEARDLRKLSIEAYVALDRSSELRWEYVNGEAFAMAGASLRHDAIVTNLVVALARKLEGRPCFPFGDGRKVETTATQSFHYPDVTVVCGKPRVGALDEHALTNPSVLVEVVSDSTGDYDRGAKFDHYATIAELREYLVVFPSTRRVEHRRRVASDQWSLTLFVGGEIRLEAIDVSLAFDEIYANLERVEPA